METTTHRFVDKFGAALEVVEAEGYFYGCDIDNLTQQLQGLRHMQLRDSDVILCTYPKAGTHWLWEVLMMLTNNTSEYNPKWKRSAMLETSDLDLIDSQPSPRVLNTHIFPRALPEMTWERSKCRLVVLHRNPKDTVVSLYNMMSELDYSKNNSAFSGTFDGFADLFLKGQVDCGSWHSYVRAWEKMRAQLPPDRMYVGTYERMRRDPECEVMRLAEFLGTGTSPALCREIVEACSFQKLKEASNTKKIQASGPSFWKPGAKGIFRKGEVGDWKNWMTSEVSAEFDAAMSQVTDLDLQFEFEPPTAQPSATHNTPLTDNGAA